jgi:hypothetical protein
MRNPETIKIEDEPEPDARVERWRFLALQRQHASETAELRAQVALLQRQMRQVCERYARENMDLSTELASLQSQLDLCRAVESLDRILHQLGADPPPKRPRA